MVGPALEPNATASMKSTANIKILCSYGGKIIPRYPDGKLRYFGGHTRVLAVDRSVSFPGSRDPGFSDFLPPSSSDRHHDYVSKFYFPLIPILRKPLSPGYSRVGLYLVDKPIGDLTELTRVQY
ncbi:hypothetical protein Nepgr_027938 [Nepenthes gracilis]|uniref:Uncharacterized protein n=1 Tax=Nepenthes gracilis TaxID=150966 RepID=A0AAD3TAR4_NEPGR|nr:hypothetical protein Nepgr_027938 [Nepenthes gracilis]